MRRMRSLATAALVLALAGCAGGLDRPTLNLQVIEALRSTLAARMAPRAERPPLTRAALDTVEGAFLEATVEARGQSAYLFVSGSRTNSSPGRIVVWRTEDNVSLAVRNGVLIETRGLGGDLGSSAVQVEGFRPGPGGSGPRVMQIRALDNKLVQISLACELTDLGPEPVEIVELRHPTRHLREHCEGGGGTVVNDYWVESRRGIVWQSRQWAGPFIGYIALRQLTD